MLVEHVEMLSMMLNLTSQISSIAQWRSEITPCPLPLGSTGLLYLRQLMLSVGMHLCVSQSFFHLIGMFNTVKSSSPALLESSCDGSVSLQGKKGTLIGGRYEVQEDVGLGTFGRVVECWDLKRRRRVAVKVVRKVSLISKYPKLIYLVVEPRTTAYIFCSSTPQCRWPKAPAGTNGLKYLGRAVKP